MNDGHSLEPKYNVIQLSKAQRRDPNVMFPAEQHKLFLIVDEVMEGEHSDQAVWRILIACSGAEHYEHGWDISCLKDMEHKGVEGSGGAAAQVETP